MICWQSALKLIWSNSFKSNFMWPAWVNFFFNITLSYQTTFINCAFKYSVIWSLISWQKKPKLTIVKVLKIYLQITDTTLFNFELHIHTYCVHLQPNLRPYVRTGKPLSILRYLCPTLHLCNCHCHSVARKLRFTNSNRPHHSKTLSSIRWYRPFTCKLWFDVNFIRIYCFAFYKASMVYVYAFRSKVNHLWPVFGIS